MATVPFPIAEQCHLAEELLVRIREADKRMRGCTVSTADATQFHANLDIARAHVERLMEAVAELQRLLREGW